MLGSKIAILGYSGHGLVVADAALKANIDLKYYIEKKKMKCNPFRLKYYGDEQQMNSEEWKSIKGLIFGIGSNEIRKRIVQTLHIMEVDFMNVIHPDTSISSFSQIGKGNFISRNVSVNIGASIGDYCIINTAAVVEHDCTIENFVHIAPGATLAGYVKIGEGSFVGANSVLKQGVKVGKNVVIGAGTVILNDVPDNTKIVGNPGRILSRFNR